MGWYAADKILYATPEMLIGKHRWKMIVYRTPHNHVYTDFLWWDDWGFGAGRWQSMEEWPKYNSNDGLYAGCPHTLRKLYDAHKAEIEDTLNAGRQAIPA